MFSPYEPLLRFRRTGGSLTPNAWQKQYVRWGLVWMLAFSLSGPLFSSRALAQCNGVEAAEEPDAEKDKVWKALNERAVEAIQNHRVVDALVAWKAAHQIKPMYHTACDIGGVELETGNPADAAYYLSDCLQRLPEPKTKNELARKVLVEHKLRQAKSQAGTIQFVVLEKGASISVDGQLKGVSPILDVFVPSGMHGLVVEKEGFQREESQIAIEKGETKTIVVNMKPAPPKEPEQPKPKEKPSAAEKKTEQKAPKAEPLQQSNKPAASSSGKRSKTLIFTGIGITGAGVVAGTAFLIAANDWGRNRDDAVTGLWVLDKYSCVNTHNTAGCTAFKPVESSQTALGNAAILSFSIAGAVGLSTLAYSLIPWKGFDIALAPSGAMVRGIW